MKIGVWVDNPEKIAGGSFTYLSTLVAEIDDFKFDQNIEIFFLSGTALTGFTKPYINIEKVNNGVSFITKVLRRVLKIISREFFKNVIDFIDQKEQRIKDAALTNYLGQKGIKLIFYPSPSASVINGIPYILNNWDLAHYTTYSFPEITDHNGFNNRNGWYSQVMPSALMILTETEAGKKELITHLNLKPDHIRVLPIFSSKSFLKIKQSTDEQIFILNTLGIEEKFFFYPAQFWVHKNHYTLIKAFQKFVATNPNFKLVLCGSDKGNKTYIESLVNDLNIGAQVIFSGFIEDNVLHTLYKNASALIMPTLLGPSNIPPIEALILGCPIICSDLKGHREILNDSALYFDPLDEFALLNCMKQIMDDSTRNKLLLNQQDLSKTTDHHVDKALIKLQEHLIEAINIRNCWA